MLLRQSQKSIEFEEFLIKNSLSSFNIAIDWCCYSQACPTDGKSLK